MLQVGHITKSLPRLILCILGSSVCCVSFDTSFGRIRLLTASRSGGQSPRSFVQASPAVTSPFMNILMMFAVDMRAYPVASIQWPYSDAPQRLQPLSEGSPCCVQHSLLRYAQRASCIASDITLRSLCPFR
ncbi:hypothetical protein OH76DRAFT_974138 [Lentinus brumalis]|uniref:Uncharacterized protein n=1 Tax=Lentinus brumalis TaxID=2498619 RepID=A0A371DPV5_9APHY|nr:hypothetical protein OH76DRAFT_974138 [Polyporus brumalis]